MVGLPPLTLCLVCPDFDFSIHCKSQGYIHPNKAEQVDGPAMLVNLIAIFLPMTTPTSIASKLSATKRCTMHHRSADASLAISSR